MKRTCHHPHRHGGQALIEFALVVPMFLSLAFMVLEAGRFGASLIMVTNAAREAAHAGSFVSVTTDAPLLTAANQSVPMLGTLPASAVRVTPAGTDNGGPGRTTGGTISVTVTFNYTVLPLFSNVLGTTIPMSASSVAPVE
jgi:Flp pilus assembly protein TadG